MNEPYDLIIIGGGSAGLTAAGRKSIRVASEFLHAKAAHQG